VVKATRGQTRTPSQAKASDPGWAKGLRVQVGGSGVVAHAGVVVPRLLADRVGLTAGLGQVLTRAGFTPGRDRGQVLADGMCALAAGATCASDVEALTRAQEIFGPGGGASDTTFGSCLAGPHIHTKRTNSPNSTALPRKPPRRAAYPVKEWQGHRCRETPPPSAPSGPRPGCTWPP
jgi:hypothetical protein